MVTGELLVHRSLVIGSRESRIPVVGSTYKNWNKLRIPRRLLARAQTPNLFAKKNTKEVTRKLTMLVTLFLSTVGKNLIRFYFSFFEKKALTLAGETLQKSSQALPKFVVVLVEGRQYLSSSLVLLRNAVEPLQALGVTVFVVGIGNRLNSQELVSMVQNSEQIVRVSGFADLLRQVESIAQLIGKKTKRCT